MFKKQNRLAAEKSPYLLQHADNPVDWYPWGEDAFKAAQEQDKNQGSIFFHRSGKKGVRSEARRSDSARDNSFKIRIHADCQPGAERRALKPLMHHPLILVFALFCPWMAIGVFCMYDTKIRRTQIDNKTI